MKKLLLIAAIFSFMFIIEQAWAQDSDSMGEGFLDDPGGHFFGPDGNGMRLPMP